METSNSTIRGSGISFGLKITLTCFLGRFTEDRTIPASGVCSFSGNQIHEAQWMVGIDRVTLLKPPSENAGSLPGWKVKPGSNFQSKLTNFQWFIIHISRLYLFTVISEQDKKIKAKVKASPLPFLTTFVALRFIKTGHGFRYWRYCKLFKIKPQGFIYKK